MSVLRRIQEHNAVASNLNLRIIGVYTLNVKSIYRKILVAFDADLLRRIERERRLQKLDRTKFIRKAVKAYVVSEEFRRASGEQTQD